MIFRKVLSGASAVADMFGILCDVLCIVCVVVGVEIKWQAMSLRIVRKRKSNVD